MNKICIMNKIGFQNFRRFLNFEPIEYSGITFLVGRNNAGKSTLVKALLLIDNYFKSNDIYKLSLGNDVLENANIVTYERAKNRFASENIIRFIQQVEHFKIDLELTGEDGNAFADVKSLEVTDLKKNLFFEFNMQAKYLRVEYKREFNAAIIPVGAIEKLDNEVNELKNAIASTTLSKTSREYIELVSKLEATEKKRDSIQEKKHKVNQMIFELEQDFGNSQGLESILKDLLDYSVKEYERQYHEIQKGGEVEEGFENLRALKELDPFFVEGPFGHFMTLMRDYSTAYLGANPAKQSALFAIRDKNNALAQAIHEFKQLNIQRGEQEHRFVLKWMKEFEVGDDFEITLHAGEAYEVPILSNNTKIHLADKGMGSIQAMLLIMRIACVMKKVRNASEGSTITRIVNGKEVKSDSSDYRLIDRTTIIIEEPELNLHPALQSKLADLFLEVYETSEIDFLIETHSEYLIRKTQLIVKEKEFETAPNENPFSILYFDKDMKQWKMRFREDGVFRDEFGTGFFDVSSQHAINLIKRKA